MSDKQAVGSRQPAVKNPVVCMRTDGRLPSACCLLPTFNSNLELLRPLGILLWLRLCRPRYIPIFKAYDWQPRSAAGKGTTGCLFSIALLGIAIFVGIRVIPLYYSHTSFETDVKVEITRAGAHFFDDETVIKDVLGLARRNEISLTGDSVKIERSAGQVRVTIHYTVPVDFIVFRRSLNFEIKASSLLGSL